MPDRKIAKRLREARILRGYGTATDAAKALGIPYPTYATYESGRRGVRTKHAVRFAGFFNVGIDWLLTGEGA